MLFFGSFGAELAFSAARILPLILAPTTPLQMAKDTSSHTKWSLFGMWFDFFQLIAYPLYSGKFFPWYVHAAVTPQQHGCFC